MHYRQALLVSKKRKYLIFPGEYKFQIYVHVNVIQHAHNIFKELRMTRFCCVRLIQFIFHKKDHQLFREGIIECD